MKPFHPARRSWCSPSRSGRYIQNGAGAQRQCSGAGESEKVRLQVARTGTITRRYKGRGMTFHTAMSANVSRSEPGADSPGPLKN